MWKWLAVAAVPSFAGATAAHAQMKELAPADVASGASSHAVDLRLRQDHGFDRPPLLVDGMVAQQGVAENAFVGLGLARIYSRKKRGDARITDSPAAGRKPAVTFVVKF